MAVYSGPSSAPGYVGDSQEGLQPHGRKSNFLNMDFSNCEELEGLINRLGVSNRLRSQSDPVSEHLDGSPTETIGRFMELATPARSWRNSMMETRVISKSSGGAKFGPRVIDATATNLFEEPLQVGSPPDRRKRRAMNSGNIYNDTESLEDRKQRMEDMKEQIRQERRSKVSLPEDESVAGLEGTSAGRDGMADTPVGEKPSVGRASMNRVSRPTSNSLDSSVFIKEEVVTTRERRESSLTKEMDNVPMERKKLTIKIGGRMRQDSEATGMAAADMTPDGGDAVSAPPGGGIAGMGGLVTPRTTAGSSLPSLELNIYVPKAGKGWSKMKVKVFESCTTAQVIGVVLRQHKAEGRRPRLADDVRCYTLRMSDDDGSPDTDLPALGHEQKIKEFGDDTFSLCRIEGVVPQPSSKEAMGPSVEATEEEGKGGGSALVNGHMLLKVRLPMDPKTRDEGQVTLEVTPDMTLRSVLEQIGRKRALVPNHYCFKMTEEGMPIGNALEMGRVVGSLSHNELALREKVFADQPQIEKKRDLTSISDEGEDEDGETFRFNFTEFTASQYKEYEVVKINRHGSRQNRIMGIDHEYIYNHPPMQSQSFLGLKPHTKKPSRPIRDVVFVATIEPPNLAFSNLSPKERKGRFRMVYENAMGDRSQYDFETKSPHEAAEIVCRIEFLAQILRRADSMDCQPIVSSTTQGIGMSHLEKIPSGRVNMATSSNAYATSGPVAAPESAETSNRNMTKAAWTKGVGAATKAMMKKTMQLSQKGSLATSPNAIRERFMSTTSKSRSESTS